MHEHASRGTNKDILIDMNYSVSAQQTSANLTETEQFSCQSVLYIYAIFLATYQYKVVRIISSCGFLLTELKAGADI